MYDECTCGAQGRSHEKDCPMNPHIVKAFRPDGNVYCKCGGEETEDMIACDGADCLIEWFTLSVLVKPLKVKSGFVRTVCTWRHQM